MNSEQRRYYDALWARGKVVEPSSWAMWHTIRLYTARKTHFLEIGAGNRPRLPIAGSYFVDLSPRAMETLRQRDGRCLAGSAEALPFPDESFDLICAFEIVEHVPDDRAVLEETSRVLKIGERFIFSVPLHMEFWSNYDKLAGHVRRYDPVVLESLVDEHGFQIEKYNITISPGSPCCRNVGAYLASKFWRLGVALEERVALPIYTWIDRRRGIQWEEGRFPEDARGANNAIIVCRKGKA